MTPLFKTHYSFKSILTLDKLDDKYFEKHGDWIEQNRPVSVCAIAKKHNLNRIVLVEDSISGFLEAYKNLPCEFLFGWRVTCCADMTVKDQESLNRNHKIVIFINNTAGYRDFIKIHNLAATEGFYYEPRLDDKILREMWTENLTLAIPFYDSFIYQNNLTFNSCLFNYGDIKPVVFLEQHGLPFDDLLRKAAKQHADTEQLETQQVQSVYYYQKSDFLAYMTYRCIHNRSTWAKPELQAMSVDTFSYL